MENTYQEPYTPLYKDIGGLDMGGYRQPDGAILIAISGTHLPDWPKEVYLLGNIFTLEDVILGENSWENAIYV